MEEHNNQNNDVVNQQVADKQEKKQGKASCLWITIGFSVIGLFILLGIIVGGAFWYMHNQNMKTQNANEQIIADLLQEKMDNTSNNIVANPNIATTQANAELPTYKNDEFGFDLSMLPGWENYKSQEVMLGGDFNVAEVNFYLPSQVVGNNTDLSGYMHMFTISVYVTESWNDLERDQATDYMLGEVVGSNDFYTFVYSHFNGVPPTDITQEAVLNMDKIAKDIKTYQSNTSAYDDSALFDDYAEQYIDYDALYSDYYSFSNVYAQNSIEYWNCMYHYQFNYPITWSNNSMTNISDKVVLYGDNVTTTIRVEDATGMSMEEFFVKEYKKEFPKAVLAPEAEKLLMPETNTVIGHLSFAAPYERRIYWKVAIDTGNGKEIGIVMTIKGDGFTDEWDNIMSMLGTLKVNEDYREECVS